MPFNGSGTFTPPSAPTYPAVTGTTIEAANYNNALLDIYTGLTTCLTRDGQGVPSANLPMNGYKHTGAAAASASGQYLMYGQANSQLSGLTLTAGNLLNTADDTSDFIIGPSGQSDGADTRRIILRGGGGTTNSRGAYITLGGNEHASFPGQVNISPGTAGEIYLNGDTHTSGISLLTASGTAEMRSTSTSTGDTIFGNATTDGADTRRLVFRSGGSASNTRGAYMYLAGNEYAAAPGDVVIVAGSTGSIALNAGSGVTVSNGLAVGTTLSTGGAISAGGALTGTSGSFSSTLAVTGATTLTGTVNTVGDVNVGDNLTVDSTSTFADDVTVTGVVTATSFSGAGSGLTLAGATVDGFAVGYKGIPETSSAAWQDGRCREETAGVTLNTSDMAAGRVFMVYNDSASSFTITQGSGVTLRLAGTATTGNRTLAQRGFATIRCKSGTDAVIMGSGLS